MRTELPPSAHRQRLSAAAVLWLLAGGFALITTLVPAHTELLGWTPVFWLLAAPLTVLLALKPQRLRQLPARRRRRLSASHGVIWH
ncbi:MAG: hypothetical protein ABI389_04435 [Rhodanobacter sp.]